MQPSQLRACLEVALGPIYRIEREVRPSGACRRFVVEEITGGGEVLVKVLPAELAGALDAERLEREVRGVTEWLRHERIVRMLGAGAAGPFVYYLRPFVPGTTLGAQLARSGALALHRAVRIARDVLHALGHAHGVGVAHGDLQPDNVLLAGDGRAQVAECGLAAALAAATRAGAPAPMLALAAPAYVSPERHGSGGLPAPSDDLYAVGALLYEMLIGEPPADAAEPVTRRRESVPLVLGEVVARCLVGDPAARWRGPEEILMELNKLTGA